MVILFSNRAFHELMRVYSQTLLHITSSSETEYYLGFIHGQRCWIMVHNRGYSTYAAVVGHFPFINAKLPKSMAIETSYPKSAMEFRESTSRLRLLDEVERLGLQLDGDCICWDEGAKAHPRQWDRMTLYYNIAVIIFWDFFSWVSENMMDCT